MKLEVATEPLLIATTATAAIVGITTIAVRLGHGHPWIAAIALPLIGILALAGIKQIKPRANPPQVHQVVRGPRPNPRRAPRRD